MLCGKGQLRDQEALSSFPPSSVLDDASDLNAGRGAGGWYVGWFAPPTAPPMPAVDFSSSFIPPSAPITPVASAGRKIVVPGPLVMLGSASRYLRPSRYIAA